METTSENRFAELSHARRTLSGGGQIVVVDTGAIIDAESLAMIQALHSRSLGGIDSHLLKLAEKGAKNFMETYYVGYGDKSIGDCGTATIFIEGVSMLAAKAVQDSQLYNGQEASTRYIDYTKQPFRNPAGSSFGEETLELLRNFYLKGLDVMKEELAIRHPKQDDEDQKVWEKAIKARAFDIMRSFLPAGATTNLAWHTTLRHAADHLIRLRHHPLQEVREIAEATQEALDQMYPSSFKQKRYLATEDYTEKWMKEMYFLDEKTDQKNISISRDTIDKNLIKKYREILETRPKKTEPPKYLAECGTIQLCFLLDFGSFRDLQRHRAIIQRMPLLTEKFGFEQWYFDQMPEKLQKEAISFLKEYSKKIQKLELNNFLLQYYIPMGYLVGCQITGDLPAIIWLVELRSGISVHPTLRKVIQQASKKILGRHAENGLVLHIDNSEDRFNYKRGTQDIVEKFPAVT